MNGPDGQRGAVYDPGSHVVTQIAPGPVDATTPQQVWTGAALLSVDPQTAIGGGSHSRRLTNGVADP